MSFEKQSFTSSESIRERFKKETGIIPVSIYETPIASWPVYDKKYVEWLENKLSIISQSGVN